MNHPKSRGDLTPSGCRGSVPRCSDSPASGTAAQNPADSHRDVLLRTIRRLDWRFLLPHPSLSQVAFLGDDDPELTQGLRLTARTVSLLDLHWRFTLGQEPHFQTVVLRSPRLHDAQRASRLVEPGGCLYWEIESAPASLARERLRRRFAPHPQERQAPRNLARLRRHLRKLGFTDVRFHWHRPSFQGAVELVPLENEAILGFVLDGRGARFPGRVKRFGARWLHRLGLLHGLVPCLSVIACRRPCQEEA